MDEVTQTVSAYLPLALNALKALVFLIIGYIVAGMVGRLIRRRVQASKKLDDTLGSFFSSIARYAILAVVIIAVLQVFGFQATSLVAVLGAASLAIGLALQGTLSDIAAGIMLIVFRPYRIGHYVDIGGTAGTVKDLNIFTTELATPENVQIIVPNSKAWGTVIINYSAHDTRRVDFTFGIDYGDSADDAIGVIRSVVEQDQRVHRNPEPWMRVINLGDSSVDIGVRLWCATTDYWDIKFDLTKSVKEAFDQNGISIPYPHQVEIRREG